MVNPHAVVTKKIALMKQNGELPYGPRSDIVKISLVKQSYWDALLVLQGLL